LKTEQGDEGNVVSNVYRQDDNDINEYAWYTMARENVSIMAKLRMYDDDEIGLMLNFQDGNNYKRFETANNFSGNAPYSGIKIFHREGGTNYEQAFFEDVLWSSDEWYDARFGVYDDQMVVWWEDTYILNFTNSSLSTPGSIGISQLSNHFVPPVRIA